MLLPTSSDGDYQPPGMRTRTILPAVKRSLFDQIETRCFLPTYGTGRLKPAGINRRGISFFHIRGTAADDIYLLYNRVDPAMKANSFSRFLQPSYPRSLSPDTAHTDQPASHFRLPAEANSRTHVQTVGAQLNYEQQYQWSSG